MVNEKGQPLEDRTAYGKNRKWKERKLSNIELGNIMESIGLSNFEHVHQCAEVLTFSVTDVSNGNRNLKLKQAWFCKNKLCPICSWRKSLFNAHQLSEVLEVAFERYPTARLLMITLSLKNCTGDDIRDSIDLLNKGWRKMLKYKVVKTIMIGYFKSVEITYNAKTDTYHPHLHILAMVPSNYFTKNYVKHDDWVALWKKATLVSYTPVVDVRTAYHKINGKKIPIKSVTPKTTKKVVSEVTKYVSKPLGAHKLKDMNKKQKVVYELLKGLKKKKHVVYGLLFREIHKELHGNKDDENSDLINFNEEENNGSGFLEIVARWNWQRYNYYID